MDDHLSLGNTDSMVKNLGQTCAEVTLKVLVGYILSTSSTCESNVSTTTSVLQLYLVLSTNNTQKKHSVISESALFRPLNYPSSTKKVLNWCTRG